MIEKRLVQWFAADSGSVVPPDEIIRGVQQGFAFLLDLDADERVLSRDAHGREQKNYRRLVNRLRGK